MHAGASPLEVPRVTAAVSNNSEALKASVKYPRLPVRMQLWNMEGPRGLGKSFRAAPLFLLRKTRKRVGNFGALFLMLLPLLANADQDPQKPDVRIEKQALLQVNTVTPRSHVLEFK